MHGQNHIKLSKALQFLNNVCNGLVNVRTDHIVYSLLVSADYM